MSDSRRWTVWVETNHTGVQRYDDAYLLNVENGVLSFYTGDGRTVVTTLPYHAEEVKT